MIKKIFTLSSIAFFLVCNTLNALEVKLQNKSTKPVFIRFFEKKNGKITPPINNFSLRTLNNNEPTEGTFTGQAYLCISFTDPMYVNKLNVKFLKFSPNKDHNIQIDENGFYVLPPTHLPFKMLFIKAPMLSYPQDTWYLQKNDLGKWKVILQEKEDFSQKPTIIKPTIIDDQPSPQTIEVFE